MKFPVNMLKFATKTLVKNPSTTSSVMVFSLGFGLIAGNAIYGQDTRHPAPMYGENTAHVATNEVRSVKVTKASIPDTSSILVHRGSLKNIPVPTASPKRKVSAAIHSTLVRDVQSALSSVGLYEGKVDGIYGSGTQKAILQYQKHAGILPDGEASYGLLQNLKSAQAVSNLSKENSVTNASARKQASQPRLLVFDTETVARIQSGLRDNFAEEDISVDGLIGSQTKKAIKRFQKRFNLKPTGELDEQTVSKLVTAGVVSNI